MLPHINKHLDLGTEMKNIKPLKVWKEDSETCQKNYKIRAEHCIQQIDDTEMAEISSAGS